MRFLIWIFFTALAVLVQSQLSSIVGFFSAPLVIVYFFGLKSRQKVSVFEYSGSKAGVSSVLFGAFVGLMEDALSGAIIGPGMLSKGLVGFLSPMVFTDVVFRWTPLWGGIAIAVFSLLDGAVTAGARVFFTGVHLGGMTLIQLFLIRALVSVPFGIVLKP
jgi:hypothetical protein